MPVWDDIGGLLQALHSQQPADPFGAAINASRQQYPWMRRFNPLAVTTGNGPFQSESYMPKSEGNPSPGSYTVQLRHSPTRRNPKGLPDLLGREGLDWLARSDPMFQTVAQQFVASMTPQQLTRSYKRFQREREPGSKQTFDDFLRESEAQEYIGGYLTPKAAPGWTGPKGGGQYTPQQIQLLEQLKAHLSK